MGLYTMAGQEADDAIQKRLDFIVTEIRKLMDKHIDAIILTGGFGRGEGGAIFEDGRYRPINDFDIGVIVSKDFIKVRKIYSTMLQKLVERIAPEVGVKQIDIGITHPLRLRFAENLVANYEIRNGHKILYGNIDLKRLMPNLPAEKLSLLDGGIYFLSRGSGLLIPALYFLPNNSVAERYRENFQIEVDKACMAMGDALLLLKKKYHFSYMERFCRIQTMEFEDIPNVKQVCSLYLDAVQRKLQPCFAWPGDQQMIERWYTVRDIFSSFFLWFEGIRLRQSFPDWINYSYFVQKQVRDPITLRVRSILKETMKRGPLGILTNAGRSAIFRSSYAFRWAVMPMVLFSLEKDKVDSILLKRANTLLSLYEQDLGTAKSWIMAVYSYLKIFHPEGIIGELLE